MARATECIVQRGLSMPSFMDGTIDTYNGRCNGVDNERFHGVDNR